MILSTSLCERTLPPDKMALRELAGELTFKRGMEYFTRGQVIRFADHGNEVEAFVLGALVYRTGLRRQAAEILFHCDCPVGQENRFCKHAVALGLRWIMRASEETWEEAWERVVEHAVGSLRLGLSCDDGCRKLVRQALDDLLRSSLASALDLIEDAMSKTAEAWSLRIENTGGDGGWEILENLLCEGHVAAVRRAGEEVGAAARRVLNWRLERAGAGGDSGRFGERFLRMYSGHFGDDWGVAYQCLIERRWRRLSRIDDERLGLAQRRQLTWLTKQMEGWSKRFECETAIRPEESVEQLWREFSASPTLVFFERLRECELIFDQWSEWRERALKLLRRRDYESAISPLKRRSYLVNAGSGACDSERVRIWLAEGEVEEAYRAAVSGDCSDDLWLKLAALRIRTDPAGTLEIYKRLVRKSLGRKDRYSAEQAGKLLRKTRRLMKRLGREEEYGEFINDLFHTFGSQRNFPRVITGVSAK